jgi:hypothetical protein
MNTNPEPAKVNIKVTYQWVPGTAAVKPALPVWLDVNQCSTTSEVPARTGRYGYTYRWTVNRPGKILGIGGHLHDGGTYLSITNATTGQLICNSVAG